jgi:flavin reductase (DIM6/NTAB) family NADH-FMN oxidoreductase RutF
MSAPDGDAGEPRNRSGGGIAFGGGARSAPRATGTLAGSMVGMRRRWTSGIAVVTAVDAEGGLHGITVTSLMMVSNDPPMIALALTRDGAFQGYLEMGSMLGVSILEARHDFPAERFAGRAPVPDRRFTGVAHSLVEGVPILDGALAWCAGRIHSRETVGDHVLVLVEVTAARVGEDTDDPLLSYEGRYRRLEAG